MRRRGALGELELGQRGQEPGRRPALAVGALGELRPEPGDGGQPQLGEQERQAGGVDGDRRRRRSWAEVSCRRGSSVS